MSDFLEVSERKKYFENIMKVEALLSCDLGIRVQLRMNIWEASVSLKVKAHNRFMLTVKYTRSEVFIAPASKLCSRVFIKSFENNFINDNVGRACCARFNVKYPKKPDRTKEKKRKPRC